MMFSNHNLYGGTHFSHEILIGSILKKHGSSCTDSCLPYCLNLEFTILDLGHEDEWNLMGFRGI